MEDEHETLSWLPVWESAPPIYEQVLLAYTYEDDSLKRPIDQRFWRGAGHLCEDGHYSIYGEARDMEPFGVVAWMPLPDPPYAVLRGAKIVDIVRATSQDEPEGQYNDHKKGGW